MSDELLRPIERFASLLVDGGLPRMAARVFAYLVITDTDAATARELGEQLRVSPAAISGAVRYLVQTGMLERDREPGARADTYRLFDDLWYETYLRRMDVLRQWETVLGEAIDTIGRDRAGASLLETKAFLAFLIDEFPAMLERWRTVKDHG